MIVWSKKFPRWKYPLGYLRLSDAKQRFRDRATPAWKLSGFPFVKRMPGYSEQLAALKDKYAGQPVFVIGNGPSLKQTDVSRLKDQLTIGVNGIYKSFDDWGFHTDFLLFEDVEQTEKHGPLIPKIKGPTKIAALHNAHGIPRPWKDDLLFMNARLGDERYWNDIGIQFSEDFGEIVYLGSSIIYIALQLAFYLGCNPVYLVGVDFDYGQLGRDQQPGKVEVTEENLTTIQAIHHRPDYHGLGDYIGVPNFELQQKAYTIAKSRFEHHGRKIYNATHGGQLGVFDRIDFDSIFDDPRLLKAVSS